MLVLSAGAAELHLPADQGLIPADRYAEILIEAPGEALTPQGVMAPALAARWTPYPGKKINLSGEHRPVWVRLHLRQAPGTSADWVLVIEWPLLDQVDFHRYDTGHGRWLPSLQGGFMTPQAPTVKEPVSAFPFTLASGESNTVVLQVRSGSQLTVPLRLMPEAEWQAQRYDMGVAKGLLFGILGVMFFYNLSLYVFTRDHSYGAYTLYLLTIIAYELTVTGLGPIYVWPDSLWVKTHAYTFFAACSFLAATWFFRVFLTLRQAAAHLNRINQGILVFWLAMVLLLAISTATLLQQTVVIGGMLMSFVAIYTAAYLVWRGNVPARYLLIAWLAIIVATFLTLLSLIGVIDGGPWIDQSQHFGFVIETILLSMALADRIRRDRLSTEAAQRESLALARKLDQEREAKIQAQEHALEVQRQANEELELRVHGRTAELKQAMADLQRANGELAALSITDSLTGVANRRYFDDTLRREFDRSARTQYPVALLLADIDHFKRINDSVGHVAGDECLRLVANAMNACAGRSTDLVARYGGEEFAIVLPATDATQALQVAERIRRAVQDIQFISAGRRVPLSISLGVVARVTSADQALAHFIREADEALYAAKAAGRNQVMLAAA